MFILGDLNSESKDSSLNDFSNVNNFKSLDKELTCFKNPNKPSCIDSFLKNRPRCYQYTSTVETGMFDFHKLVIAVVKMFYKKQNQKSFNAETIKLLTGNYLELIWTKS